MFDTDLLPAPEALHNADDAAVIGAIEECARAEAAAGARRLRAIAELVRRRCDDDDERAHWSCDSWDSAAAEIAAALGISQRTASSQMHLGVALRDRLPRVAALHMSGKLSSRLASVIAWRTHLVEDDEALALIDTELAMRATKWGPLSAYKLEQAVDQCIDRYDPGALRRTRISARSRDVEIGARDDQTGTASMWGRLYATDAAVLKRRLTQMAHAVCDDDSRTIAQRRADALGALAAGSERLACNCGNPECPAGIDEDKRATNVVINVLAEEATLEAASDPHLSGEAEHRPVTGDTSPIEALTSKPRPGLILGGGVVPKPLLAELIRSGAKVVPVGRPVDSECESQYRPSATLQRFVRMRDMTCRFPACDRPAEICDIDHTIAYPFGPTHPSNLKCLCRLHHLLKTFWTGIGGWADVQLPDGTVIWTSPSGKTYTTHPGSRIYVPAWNTATADLGDRPQPATSTEFLRGVMMPKRRRTRAADRARRIRYERVFNDAHVAERNMPPPF